MVWGLDSLILRYLSQILFYHLWMCDQLILVSAPPTSLDGCGFFNSLVVRFPFYLISNGSERWLFYILESCLLYMKMWLYMKCTIFTYAAILSRSPYLILKIFVKNAHHLSEASMSHDHFAGGRSCLDDKNTICAKLNKMKHNKMRYACIVKLNNRMISSMHFNLRKNMI